MTEFQSFNGPDLEQEGNRTVFTEKSGIGMEGEYYIPKSAANKLAEFVLAKKPETDMDS